MLFRSELQQAATAKLAGDTATEFHHLEMAHVLGQRSTYWHTRTHLHMLAWGWRQKSIREMLGQCLRIVGAATKTAIGLVPEGNTGGSNVSPIKPLPLRAEHQHVFELIAQQK